MKTIFLVGFGPRVRNGVVHKNNSAGDNLAMFTLLKTEMDLKMKGISFLLFFSLD